MARSGYYTEAWEKKFEVYKDFSGGMNTISAQDTMNDRELSQGINTSLDERGAVGRRHGMVTHRMAVLTEGMAQGTFRHYKTSAVYDELIARGGQLEINGVPVTITGLEGGFQTDRFIEAVQYYDKTYIATGTKLLVYDGETVSVVAPYAPNPLEALYIGTNAIADDPSNFLSDGTGSTLQIAGVTFSSRYGIMNEPFTLTAYHIKKAEDTVEYQFEYRYPFMEEGKWILGQDWNVDKDWTFTAQGEGAMQFRINARPQGTEVASAQYLVPKYTIKPAKDPNDVNPTQGGIHTCNRILLHWDRLIIYGDTTNFNVIYFSHLKSPNYFPFPNSEQFQTERNEPVTSVLRFRDYIVAFTDTSIQALFGKSPADFRRVVLNTAVGCIAPKSAVVMNNYIAFLSQEGVYYLKSVGYVDDKANVARLDTPIQNMMYTDKNAVAIVDDGQYQIVFPDRNERFRYYQEMNVWVMDKSSSMDLIGLYLHDQKLYAQRKNGDVVRFDEGVYTDLGIVYPVIIETKYFDFGQPYHTKKLKELQLTMKAPEEGTVASVKVFIDGTDHMTNIVDWLPKLSPTEEYSMFVDKLKVSGRCLRVKVRIEHNLDEWMQFLGLSFIFKMKKP